MYKITLTEFFKSKDRLAIHCDTEEKANRLFKAFDRMGKRWSSGKSYLKDGIGLYIGCNECYSNTGCSSPIGYYKRNNNTVYEFEEVDLEEDFKMSIMKEIMCELVKNWELVEQNSFPIRSVTLNEKKKITTVVFADGDVKMVKCGENDTYSPEMGITYCIALKAMGMSKTQYKKMINELIGEE